MDPVLCNRRILIPCGRISSDCESLRNAERGFRLSGLDAMDELSLAADTRFVHAPVGILRTLDESTVHGTEPSMAGAQSLGSFHPLYMGRFDMETASV